MKKIILIVVVLGLVFYSGNTSFAQIWIKIEGTKNYINKIFFPNNLPNVVCIANDDLPTDVDASPINFPIVGGGIIYSTDGGITFENSALEGYSVYDIVQDNTEPANWFAGVRFLTRGGVVTSTNNGVEWQTMVLKCNSSYQIYKIHQSKANSNEYYNACINTPYGFMLTTDSYQNCIQNQNFTAQLRDISLSPLREDLLFVASDGVYQSGVYRSYDNGVNWLKDESGLEGLEVLCVLASDYDPAMVLCGTRGKNGGIYQSLDTGKTWKKVPGPSSTVYSIVKHPTNPRYLASACDTSGVWISGSYGSSWEQFKDGLPEGEKVFRVGIAPIEPNEDGIIVYASPYGQGLYRSARITTDVKDYGYAHNGGVANISVYPQPSQGSVTLSWFNPKPQLFSFELYALLGEKVWEKQNVFYEHGKCAVILDFPKDLPPGVYLLLIRTERDVIPQKVILE